MILIKWCSIHYVTILYSVTFILFLTIPFLYLIYGPDKIKMTILLLFSVVSFSVLTIKIIYPNELERYEAGIKKEKLIKKINGKIDKDYRMIVKGKEIYSYDQKKEMIRQYTDVDCYIDYDDNKKSIYIRKSP